MRVILASTSRYRQELFSRLGIAFESVAPLYDEETAKESLAHLSVADRALVLAKEKAFSVSTLHADAVVIGSDQIVSIDGEVLSKPKTVDRAIAQLTRLSGKTHTIHTAVVMSHRASGRLEGDVTSHSMVMRSLDRKAIERYVLADCPLDCAGSYRVEALGVALFEKIVGDDFTAVIGLPLTRVAAMLSTFGIEVP